MQKKQWQIDDLNDKLRFCNAAGVILKNRLNKVQEDIKDYFSSESVEGLHRIRIALRRLRYSMELFISCYDNKKFMILYKKVTGLQDLSGKVRDFDVMKENIKVLQKEEKVTFSPGALKRVDALRDKFHVKLKLDLMKFMHSKAVKSFEELL